MSLRIDKWLWAARFFKTRALASEACGLGRIESNIAGKQHRAKPSREVHLGDQLRIVNEAGIFEVEVLLLNEVRGPAATAQTMYRESDSSRAARAKAAEDSKLMLEAGGFTENRPTKQDRRAINKLRGRIHRF
jgi:ribosome-associated heat shock protein Hsp15